MANPGDVSVTPAPRPRSTGTILDLHFPRALITVTGLSLFTAMGYALLNPDSRGLHSVGEWLHFVGLVTVSTLALTAAFVFLFSPSSGAAELYAAMNVLATAALLSLVLAWLQRPRLLSWWYADRIGVALGLSAMAITPTLVAHVFQLVERRRDKQEPKPQGLFRA